MIFVAVLVLIGRAVPGAAAVAMVNVVDVTDWTT